MIFVICWNLISYQILLKKLMVKIRPETPYLLFEKYIMIIYGNEFVLHHSINTFIDMFHPEVFITVETGGSITFPIHSILNMHKFVKYPFFVNNKIDIFHLKKCMVDITRSFDSDQHNIVYTSNDKQVSSWNLSKIEYVTLMVGITDASQSVAISKAEFGKDNYDVNESMIDLILMKIAPSLYFRYWNQIYEFYGFSSPHKLDTFMDHTGREKKNTHFLKDENFKIRNPRMESTDPTFMIYTGMESNLTVIDIDNFYILEMFYEKFPFLKNILRVNTYKGIHFYFRYEPLLRTSTNTIGIDIRNDDAIVFSPPTMYETLMKETFQYTWEKGHLIRMPNEFLFFLYKTCKVPMNGTLTKQVH